MCIRDRLYDERFTYTDPYGIEDTYFYQVPHCLLYTS